jgi:methyl-accepting chemotaxis protein
MRLWKPRVGEQGRGFAVVAAEVRSLAGRSATAAKEIKSLVQDTVGKVGEGSELVNRSGQTLEEIVTSVKKVADIIAEISAASQEQSVGIEQVNKAIMQMDQITQQNAALVEEAAAASQSTSQQAKELQGLVSQFKLDPSFLQSLQMEQTSQEASQAAERARHMKATGTDGRGGSRFAGRGTSATSTPRLTLSAEDKDAFEEF